MNKRYDYLILGGGAAGLSLAYRMMHDAFFDDKMIGIIEPDDKNTNDRTWCFWTKEGPIFSDIVSKKWNSLIFKSDDDPIKLDTGGYSYHMIRGIDLYEKVIPELKNKINFDWIAEKVISIDESYDHVSISLESKSITTDYVFKSYVDFSIDSSSQIYVEQHFKGFWIEMKSDYFNENEATFMDFSIDQQGETRFMYVLPQNKRKALVELAIFSNDLLDQDEYDSIIKDYIKNQLKIDDYTIEEKEYGIIPMTTYPFYEHDTDRVIGIGTMAGCVKPSSGYAFERIQRHSDQLIARIKDGKSLHDAGMFLRSRYAYYDKIFLDAVLNGNTTGKEVFTKLFEKRTAHDIFRFLDQKNTFVQDVQIFQAPPFWPFLTSFFKTL